MRHAYHLDLQSPNSWIHRTLSKGRHCLGDRLTITSLRCSFSNVRRETQEKTIRTQGVRSMSVFQQFQDVEDEFRSEILRGSKRTYLNKRNEARQAVGYFTLKQLATSRSTTGIGDCNAWGSKLANDTPNGDFPKRLARRRTTQQSTFLTGRQVAWMIIEHFKTREPDGAVLDLSDLLTVELRNDNLQSFDTQWDETIIAMRKASRRGDPGESQLQAARKV